MRNKHSASKKRTDPSFSNKWDRCTSLILDLIEQSIIWKDHRTGTLRTVADIVTSIEIWQAAIADEAEIAWQPGNIPGYVNAINEVSRLVSPPMVGRFSFTFLSQELSKLCFAQAREYLTHRDRERTRFDCKQAVVQLINRLDNWEECWDVLIPIVDLRLLIGAVGVRIGPVLIVRDDLNTHLRDGHPEYARREFGRWALNRLGLDTAEGKEQWGRTVAGIDTYAKVFAIRGDQEYAREIAEWNIESALSILRLVDDQLGSFLNPRQRFGMMGLPRGGFRFTLLERHSIWSNPLSIDQLAPVDPEYKPMVRTFDEGEPAVDRLLESWTQSDVRFPVKLTGGELMDRWQVIDQLENAAWPGDGPWKSLATATRWFSDATQAATPEDAFVKYAIALDVVLGKEESGYSESLTTRAAERLAFLLGDGDNEKRLQIFALSKDLFKIRGGVVHGGEYVDISDLTKMESVTRLAIMRLAWEVRHRDHVNIDAFIRWVKRLKFGEAFEELSVPSYLRITNEWLTPKSP